MVVGAQSIGRCVLYLYRSENLMVQRIATGNRRNSRQVQRLTKAWRCKIVAKLSKLDAPSKWVLGTEVWNQWRCHAETCGNDANWRRTACPWRNPADLKVLLTSRALKLCCPWHWWPIALLWCLNESWIDVWRAVTVVWDVSTNR